MPEFSLTLIIFLIFVGLFTATTTITDLRNRRIPNMLTLPMFLLGLIFQSFNSYWGANPQVLGEAGLANGLIGFAVGFGILFVLWVIGGGGGGDVKLVGALSIWLGFPLTLHLLILTTLCVMIGSLGVLLIRLVVKRKKTQSKMQMSYAPPVSIATWILIIWKLFYAPI